MVAQIVGAGAKRSFWEGYLRLPKMPSKIICRAAPGRPFAAAAYFTGRLYGKTGLLAIAGGYVVIVTMLALLGGLRFG
jgi:hypothetical protein